MGMRRRTFFAVTAGLLLTRKLPKPDLPQTGGVVAFRDWEPLEISLVPADRAMTGAEFVGAVHQLKQHEVKDTWIVMNPEAVRELGLEPPKLVDLSRR